MLNLIRNGGFPVLFVLAFGFVALGAAARYAAKRAQSLDFIRGMALATLFSTLSATAGDLGATFAHVSGQMEKDLLDPGHAASTLLEGLGESMSPGILGFSLLALVALLVAIGKQRRTFEEEVSG